MSGLGRNSVVEKAYVPTYFKCTSWVKSEGERLGKRLSSEFCKIESAIQNPKIMAYLSKLKSVSHEKCSQKKFADKIGLSKKIQGISFYFTVDNNLPYYNYDSSLRFFSIVFILILIESDTPG